MARPRRRYYIGLARELGMTVSQMLEAMTSDEIAEQMAFDALKDDDFRGRLERERDRIQSLELSPEERSAQFKKLLTPKG